MKKYFATAALALIACTTTVRAAEKAHVHGVARLDIAVEPRRVSIQLNSPLENLIGFERAPRTEAERRRADAAVAKLNAGASMFKIDPAAQCKLAAVQLASAALKLGTPDAKADQSDHADIDGSFEFDCVDATKAGHLDVGLFEFSPLKRLEVQVATPAGQFKRDLRQPAARIRLTP